MVNFGHLKVEQEFQLLEDGIYNFEFIRVQVDGKSSTGRESILLRLKIEHNGNKFIIFDTIPLMEKMMFKVKHLCESVGKLDCYDAGILKNEDLLGAKGSVSIFTDEYNGKKSNKVKYYLVGGEQQININKSAEEEPLIDDNIPF